MSAAICLAHIWRRDWPTLLPEEHTSCAEHSYCDPPNRHTRKKKTHNCFSACENYKAACCERWQNDGDDNDDDTECHWDKAQITRSSNSIIVLAVIVCGQLLKHIALTAMLNCLLLCTVAWKRPLFNCSFVSGVQRRIYISTTVTKRQRNSVGLIINISLNTPLR